MIKLVEAHEKEEERLDRAALIQFEKSVFFAPWNAKAREKLNTAVKALPTDQIEETATEEGGEQGANEE